MLATRRRRLSPWVTLIERDIPGDDGPRTFHAFEQADYTNVLAFSADGRVPLVRQYRPSLDTETLEFPGGLVDDGEAAVESAARELYEEAGCRCAAGLQSLGVVAPDVGRLDNRLWCFLAADVTVDPTWTPEPGVAVEWRSPTELRAAILDGRFLNGTSLCVLALAFVGDGLPPAIRKALQG